MCKQYTFLVKKNYYENPELVKVTLKLIKNSNKTNNKLFKYILVAFEEHSPLS